MFHSLIQRGISPAVWLLKWAINIKEIEGQLTTASPTRLTSTLSKKQRWVAKCIGTLQHLRVSTFDQRLPFPGTWVLQGDRQKIGAGQGKHMQHEAGWQGPGPRGAVVALSFLPCSSQDTAQVTATRLQLPAWPLAVGITTRLFLKQTNMYRALYISAAEGPNPSCWALEVTTSIISPIHVATRVQGPNSSFSSIL